MERGSVTLRKNEERRIKAGHLWVFSNEIAETSGNPGNGELIRVVDARGACLGIGFYNRNSLISVRLLCRDEEIRVEEYIRRRLLLSGERRRMLGFDGAYRLVHGEADGLPGLVIDRYGDLFVVESFCAGMDLLLPLVADLLREMFQAGSIVEKSDSIWRQYEGLPARSGLLFGESSSVVAESRGLRYEVDALESQKTGLFLDQSENRAAVESISSGRRVLDMFCHVGGFSLHAARGGASSVTGVDSSPAAVEQAQRNARRNGIDTARFLAADATQHLESLGKGIYDLIILDPPAYVRSARALAAGLHAYRRLNERAIDALADGGVLVTCSCSHHVTPAMFEDMLQGACARRKRRAVLFRAAGAAADHPVLPAMPETRYLTCLGAFIEAM